MGCPNPGAGQHGDGGLRHHGHVEGHQIALTNPKGLQGIGGLADLLVQLAVGEGAHVPRLTLPNQGWLFSPGTIQVAIQAVEGEVGGAPLKPLGKGGIGPIEHGVKRLEPVQVLAGHLSPKAIGIGPGSGRQVLIGRHRVDPGRGGQRGGRFKDPLLLQHRFNGGVFGFGANGLAHGVNRCC